MASDYLVYRHGADPAEPRAGSLAAVAIVQAVGSADAAVAIVQAAVPLAAGQTLAAVAEADMTQADWANWAGLAHDGLILPVPDANYPPSYGCDTPTT